MEDPDEIVRRLVLHVAVVDAVVDVAVAVVVVVVVVVVATTTMVMTVMGREGCRL